MKYINEGLIVPYIAAPVFTSGSGGILTISGSVNISGSLNGTDVLDTQILFKSGSTLTGNSNFIYNYPTNSFQHGDTTQALGVASHAEGQYTVANNLGSHAEGYATVTGEAYAHAEGSLSQALGGGSHAEGGQCLASGVFAHAEGYYTRADGVSSHAEGSSSIALGVASHAGGLHTIASGAFQTTVGKYNKQGNTTDLFIVGGGSADNNRKDVFNVSTTAITMSGSINISGSLTVPSGITANLTGTSSWATNAVTASLAPNYVLNSSTSSFVQNSQTSSFVTNSQTSSMTVATASYVTSSKVFGPNGANSILSASYALTSSYAANISSYNVTQSFTNLSTWTFNHNLGYQYVLVQAYDSTNAQIVPQTITLTNTNTATLTFPVAITGYAVATVGGALATATASYTQTAVSSSYATTASFASTASYINILNQNVLITGSLTIGSGSTGPSENTLTLGAKDSTNEGGQIGFNAPGGSYTSASFIDNYQNQFRILSGPTNAGSTAELIKIDLKNGNTTINGGSIIMPTRPAFRVSGSSTTGISGTTISGSAAVGIDYNQGSYYNNTNGIFTVPIAGLYHVWFNCRTQTAGSQQVIIKKNASLGGGGGTGLMMWETNANTGHFGISSVLNLAVNDTLQAVVTVGTVQFDNNDNWGAAFIG